MHGDGPAPRHWGRYPRGVALAYLLLTLLTVLALLLFLLRPGLARAGVVWGLGALLPLLAALVVALQHGA